MQVQFELLDKHGVFTLRAAPGNTCRSIQCTVQEDATDSGIKGLMLECKLMISS